MSVAVILDIILLAVQLFLLLRVIMLYIDTRKNEVSIKQELKELNDFMKHNSSLSMKKESGKGINADKSKAWMNDDKSY